MVRLQDLSPTHSDIAIVVGGRGKFKNPNDKTPESFIIQIALQGTETMPVRLPWNTDTKQQLSLLKQTILDSPVHVCGVRFDNLQIHQYNNSAYYATATNIKEIIK